MVEVYVVKEIHDSTVIIYALELTPERDNIVVTEKIVTLSELIHIDDIFVSVNGFLWAVRERLRAGRPIDVFDILNEAT